MRARIEWAFVSGTFVGVLIVVASGIWWTLPLALAIAFAIEVLSQVVREEMARMHARIDRELEWDREEWADE